MTLKVFPPVHSLSLLTQEQMKSAFSLPKKLNALFFEYISNEGTLKVTFGVEEFYDKDFHLFLEP